MREITGTVVVAGDNITTDHICPAPCRGGKRADIVKSIFRECPALADKKLPAEAILIAGDSFGGGPEPALAASALLAAGVRCVIARSFPREFFRPAVNAGLALVTADLRGQLSEGDRISVNLRKGTVLRGEQEFPFGKYAERVARIVEQGGLVSAVRKELGKE
ncbi:MAG TPA: 3-isopropylmalate dehydratase [candidate division Zixibacteria bacterium]|nr:3-isopropylmalate dehydratase [candidate division Zixibacteria bacterium]MDD4918278.1 3-isopropylmalate dehydratase [candidate division Zixibacteria bacterium]MDM7973177.1 3-isopropylmalate dehydratase [candidate division Zixibacteria bacterium]HOD65857.1 3-isopropylmalate dehydratase [candidate division Zixibacteria bacterium]HOZ07749.1 3-isopropylmalate dehydratase [candidate division Zixibacteria bacterium]